MKRLDSRYRIAAALTLALSVVLAGSVVFADDAGSGRPLTPDEMMKQFMDGNERYARAYAEAGAADTGKDTAVNHSEVTPEDVYGMFMAGNSRHVAEGQSDLAFKRRIRNH